MKKECEVYTKLCEHLNNIKPPTLVILIGEAFSKNFHSIAQPQFGFCLFVRLSCSEEYHHMRVLNLPPY